MPVLNTDVILKLVQQVLNSIAASCERVLFHWSAVMGKVERVFSPGFNAAEFIMHFGYTSFGQLAGNIWSLFSVSFCHYVVFESIDMGPTVMLITKQFAGGKEIPKCVCVIHYHSYRMCKY